MVRHELAERRTELELRFETVQTVHEVAIAEALLEEVEREAAAAGACGRVERLRVTVGRLSGVYPEALRFAFEALSAGTRAAGAELEIREVPAFLRCQRCGERTVAEDLFSHCARCGSAEVAVEGGQELLLDSIEVEEASPAGT